jgi:tRNA pseudouridine55 synthase
MLPICFGEATKISSFLLDSDKSYLTTAQLGITTTTGDAEGEVLDKKAVPILTAELIETVLDKYRGAISQIPPMYSALKHQGKPLYELARQGIEIERKRRDITIHKLTLVNFTDDSLELEVDCSKGTYIRTLVEDIGHDLGCGAYVTKLHRTQVMPFVDKMLDWEVVENTARDELDNLLLPVDAGLTGFAKVILSEKQTIAILYGQAVEIPVPEMEPIRIYNNNEEFIGMGIATTNNLLKPKRIMQQPA